LFDPAFWEQTRLDVDRSVEPDVIGSITDMSRFFRSGHFDAVYSSHSLEHLHTHEISLALKEFHRVLKVDGFAAITCPDLETVMTLFLEHGPDHVVYRSPAGPITPLDMMFGHGQSIASGNPHMAHRSGFTAQRLGDLLLHAGFSEVITRRHGYDLWALALRERADRKSAIDQLAASGINVADE
jgi:SAM-dependent methyltransferase